MFLPLSQARASGGHRQAVHHESSAPALLLGSASLKLIGGQPGWWCERRSFQNGRCQRRPYVSEHSFTAMEGCLLPIGKRGRLSLLLMEEDGSGTRSWSKFWKGAGSGLKIGRWWLESDSLVLGLIRGLMDLLAHLGL